jgi:multidrug efflux pump subunit AcrB
MPSGDITAQLVPGYGLNEVASQLASVIQSHLTPGENYAFGGQIQAYLSSAGTMLTLFALSLVFIYLVLAAQFESFVDPFIILLTVPLCIVGALTTLKLAGGSLNLYTNIGLITLVGLITKHGILITQFANTRLKEGDDLIQAIKQAGITRLRPILMTTLAMVLGSIPLALASGPGSISHQQIGWVIVGGMLFGTVFSLFVVPVAYYFLARFDHKKKPILQARKQGMAS